ncbi:MAG: DUF4981 domain-containing protein [Lachnospiraceae bacterium]|nr:DUF4981 domain-containing protein [Lachnospiraceae bacterium]
MKAFDFNIVRDPKVFCENRLPAHSDHVAYASRQELEAQESSLKISLDGLWKFRYSKNPELAEDGFWETSCNTEDWDDIRVPAHIQFEGYGKPQYCNTAYPWDGCEDIVPGQIPEKFNPVADYVTFFTIPNSAKGMPLRISFEGVESGFALWLNGIYIGYSENSFDPADFDLTPAVKEGVNKLAVRVFRWTSGAWTEDQDFYRFSGIFRSVSLYFIPTVHISDISLVPLVSDDFKTGILESTFTVEGEGNLRLSLSDGEKVMKEVSIPVKEGENKNSLDLGEVKLWSAEDPKLYEVMLTLEDGEGNVKEVIRQMIGFRRFEVKDGLMLLNGKRIVFKGVNRHDFNTHSGRVPDAAAMEKDILTMKKNNINAVRTSHYPSGSALYGLCDRYGIYLIAENNMETHGTWDAYIRKRADLSFVIPKDNDDWMGSLLDRVNQCYQRDKNHPSILIWSCGNEAFGGKVIYEMSQLFRKLDPHRVVHYEGIFNDRSYPDTSDIESQMYPSVEKIKEFLAEHPGKPMICCEYAHAMGNSNGAIFKYTELADTEERYQGGFIWDYIDQSIMKKDRYGEWFQAYGGDHDERPTDYDFSGNGIVTASKREASPKMQEVKYVYQNISVTFKPEENAFTVRNKNLFTDTGIYTARISLFEEGRRVLQQDTTCSVAPLSEGEFKIPEAFAVKMQNLKEAAASLGKKEPEFVIRVSFLLAEETSYAPAGHEVAFDEYVYKTAFTPYSCSKKLRVAYGKNNIGVFGEHFNVKFSGILGGLTSYVYGGKEMIKEMVKPNFWRAPISNDNGNMMQQRYAQWKIASMYVAARRAEHNEEAMPEVTEKENSVVVSFNYYMPTTPASMCKVNYEIFGDGMIETTLTYDPVKELGDMPEFGMIMKIDADYDKLTWYGLGPAETYEDRQKGGKLEIHQMDVPDHMPEYLVPQECGNHCGVRYAKVTDHTGRGMIFEGDSMSFSALPFTPHELENAAHPFELPKIHYTVIRAAKQQMGVGGDDSWGAKTHPEYLLDISKKMEFTFRFKGI